MHRPRPRAGDAHHALALVSRRRGKMHRPLLRLLNQEASSRIASHRPDDGNIELSRD